jgi:hypothetical protein
MPSFETNPNMHTRASSTLITLEAIRKLNDMVQLHSLSKSNRESGIYTKWIARGWQFSPGPPVSSTNKTDRHDITETLLKVALKHHQTNKQT